MKKCIYLFHRLSDKKYLFSFSDNKVNKLITQRTVKKRMLKKWQMAIGNKDSKKKHRNEHRFNSCMYVVML